MPEELLKEVKHAAEETGLSVADVMCQAIKLGVPHVRQAVSGEEDMSEVMADTWEKLGPAPRINYDAIETR